MNVITNLGEYRRAKTLPMPYKVERFPDPDFANRCSYIISSASKDTVQSIVASLIAEVESFANGGEGHFDAPRLFNGFYYVAGTVVVFPDAMPAEIEP